MREWKTTWAWKKSLFSDRLNSIRCLAQHNIKPKTLFFILYSRSTGEMHTNTIGSVVRYITTTKLYFIDSRVLTVITKDKKPKQTAACFVQWLSKEHVQYVFTHISSIRLSLIAWSFLRYILQRSHIIDSCQDQSFPTTRLILSKRVPVHI